MRISSLALVTALALSAQAQAGEDCPDPTWEKFRAENASIMASVLPASTGEPRLAQEENVHILHGLPDFFARLSEEDLAQIRSVQPQGKKQIYCLSGQQKPVAN